MTAQASVPETVAARPADASLLRVGTDEPPVTRRVSIARSFWGRFRGLMGRASLADDEGVYLASNSIHMLFMRFPIDALFLSALTSCSNDVVLGCGQLGAHLQSLTIPTPPGGVTADSGFLLGTYLSPAPPPLPEPGTLSLLAAVFLALGLLQVRRIRPRRRQ